MLVGLRLYVKGIERRYRYLPEDPWGKTPWAQKDLPEILYGESNPNRKVRINRNSFKSL